MKKLIFLLTSLLMINSCNRADDVADIQEEKSKEMVFSDNILNKLSQTKTSNPIKFFVDTKTWMGQLDDDTRLVDITMVGSHDAGAYRRGGALVITQRDDIKTQLESGVRYLDIRLNYDTKKDALIIYHGIVSQNLDFNKDVLNVVSEFLRENPSEMVFLVVKNESGKNIGKWLQKINADFSQYSETILRYYSVDTPLKNARGKMAIISRAGYLEYGKNLWGYQNNNATFGSLGDEQIFFSDKYNVPTILTNDIHNKASVIFDGIYKAQKREHKDSWFIINANGSSAFAYPISVSNRINPMLANYLAEYIYQPYQANVPTDFVAKRSGIIVIDFATSQNGKRIIDWAILQSLLANNKAYQRMYEKTPNYID